MTSMAAESVSTILVSCKQTRFHIETPNYRELDIEGLNITVTSGDTPSAKGKGKAKAAEGTEILSNATLRLKAGSRYAVVGRNGSGKSTLLKAIAEKLIPGIPEQTRVSILQQTDANDGNTQGSPPKTSDAATQEPTVLEDVIDRATAKSELEQEINALSAGVNADAFGTVKALRRLRHERMQKRLFILDKDARLRSGARGLQARKALKQFEKEVAESAVLIDQTEDDIPPETLQTEIQEAADMLADLQLQVEPSRLADIESQAKKILTGLGFTDAYMARPAHSLSGGWRMRSALATALLQETDILILDEPTNFLDLLGIIWLQRYLTSLATTSPTPPTLLLVSHDRDFISLCTDLLLLQDHSLTYFHGDLPTYEAAQSERHQHLTKLLSAQEKQRTHMQATVTQNLAAARRRPDDQAALRQAKSRQKRLDDRLSGIQTSARGGRFKLNRDLAGYHTSQRSAIDLPPPPHPSPSSSPRLPPSASPARSSPSKKHPSPTPVLPPRPSATSPSPSPQGTVLASSASTAPGSPRFSVCSRIRTAQASPATRACAWGTTRNTPSPTYNPSAWRSRN